MSIALEKTDVYMFTPGGVEEMKWLLKWVK